MELKNLSLGTSTKGLSFFKLRIPESRRFLILGALEPWDLKNRFLSSWILREKRGEGFEMTLIVLGHIWGLKMDWPSYIRSKD